MRLSPGTMGRWLDLGRLPHYFSLLNLEVTKESDQDDERNGHAQQEKQNGSHRVVSLFEEIPIQIAGTLSRCLPPIVAPKLAQKAPIRSARNVQYIACAIALRAVSAAC